MKAFARTVTTENPFEEAVPAIGRESAESGFRGLHAHDVAATLAAKGAPREPLKITAYAALLLLLLTAGCAHVVPDTPVSGDPNVATQPGTLQPVAKPAAPATLQPAPAAARVLSAGTPAPQATSEAARPVAKTPAAVPALDLNTLEAQLRETKAIGFLTKLALKNQVDDLLDRFSDYYAGKAKLTMTDLRRSYDLLMMKVLSLLQDEDQKLASDIVSSRETIWGLLADPKSFATV